MTSSTAPDDSGPDLPKVIVGRRPGPAWVPVTRGGHRPAEVDDPLRADLAVWQAVLPGQSAFTHLSAARLRAWWLPPLPEDIPHFAATVLGRNASIRRGIRVSRHKQLPASELIDGLRVASPAEALLACAGDLGLIDVVVLVTSALRAGGCTMEELTTLAAGRRRGTRLLRKALPLVDTRCESPWEVLLLLLHRVCDVDVEPQFTVTDDTGAFVAKGDLLLVGTRVLHEYDGGDHLKKPQQRKDLKRSTRLGHADWIRRGYTANDLIAQGITILRDADASLGREHRPERIRPWHELLRHSLFTPAGTARVRKRLSLGAQIADLGG
jgi:hypothetical protein